MHKSYVYSLMNFYLYIHAYNCHQVKIENIFLHLRKFCPASFQVTPHH